MNLELSCWFRCSGNHRQKFYYGHQEIMIPGLLEFEWNYSYLTQTQRVLVQYLFNTWTILFPVYKEMSEAMNKHPDADVMINFASLRSAYDATLEAMQFPQVTH